MKNKKGIKFIIHTCKTLILVSLVATIILIITILFILKPKDTDYSINNNNEGRNMEEYALITTCDLSIDKSYSCSRVRFETQDITVALFFDNNYYVRLYDSENALIYQESIPSNFFTEDMEDYDIYLENDASIHLKGSIMIFKNKKAMFVGFLEEAENNKFTIQWKP